MLITRSKKAYCFILSLAAFLALIYIIEPKFIALTLTVVHKENVPMENCKTYRKLLNTTITTTDVFMKLASECCPDNNTTSQVETLSAVFSVNCFRKYKYVSGCDRSIPHFLKTRKPLVALASYAGSGNTWTRQLLEYLTEINTGSVYMEGASTFEGSKIYPTSGKVFIVKTHGTNKHVITEGCNQTDDFSKAIFIIRNPYDAMIAEFNRVTSGKTETSKKGNFQSERWNTFVAKNSDRWVEKISFWLTTFEEPVHLLMYEHLTSNPALEMFKILQFLDMPVRIKSLLCLSKLQFETFYRKLKPAWMRKEVLFNNDLKAMVNSRINSTLKAFQGNEKVANVLRGYLLK